jgi:hypothetical protein
MSVRDDDRILREMLSPNLDEALEALAYWLERRTRLPLHRRAARREAERMIGFWQARAIADAPRSPIALIGRRREVVRVTRLTAEYHARRVLGRMTMLALAAVAAVTALGMLHG